MTDEEFEKRAREWAEERKWIIQAKDDAIDHANVVTLMADALKAELAEMRLVEDTRWRPTIERLKAELKQAKAENESYRAELQREFIRSMIKGSDT